MKTAKAIYTPDIWEAFDTDGNLIFSANSLENLQVKAKGLGYTITEIDDSNL